MKQRFGLRRLLPVTDPPASYVVVEALRQVLEDVYDEAVDWRTLHLHVEPDAVIDRLVIVILVETFEEASL